VPDGSTLIDGLANHVDDTAKGLRTDGNLDSGSGVRARGATDKSFGGVHSNGTDSVFTQVLGNLEDKTGLVFGDFDVKGVQDRGQVALELNIHDGTNDLGDLSDGSASGGHGANHVGADGGLGKHVLDGHHLVCVCV
jgi:hypothetical protein